MGEERIVNRRILIGVPLIVPNPWFPTGIIDDNANPTTPNVVLELNYKQLNTAGSLADRVAVNPSSYTGKLIARDVVRKWSIWTVKSPCAAFVQRDDNTNPVFVGNSDHTGKIYSFVEDLLEDDGVAIDQRYTTYGFPTSDQAQAMQIGMGRKQFGLMRLVIDGEGLVEIKIFPDTLDTPYSSVLRPDFDLSQFTNGNLEVPNDEKGERLFLRFRSDAVGAGFNLSNVLMAMRKSAYDEVRGRNN